MLKDKLVNEYEEVTYDILYLDNRYLRQFIVILSKNKMFLKFLLT